MVALVLGYALFQRTIHFSALSNKWLIETVMLTTQRTQTRADLATEVIAKNLKLT